MKRIMLFILLLIFSICYCFSEDSENNWEFQNHSSLGDGFVNGLIAGGEILLGNALLSLGNYIVGYGWALPNAQSINYNITNMHRWRWEIGDGHIVNCIGHPYQGANYFSFARANNFGYYQSAFFSVFGSLTWEIFCERQTAGYNDVIVTTFGSMALGEILYRLYVEARLSGIPAPLAFLINPAAGFHSLVSGWKPSGPGGHIYQLQTYIGASYYNIRYERDNLINPLFSFDGFAGDAGINVIYGNPFETESFTPYKHFEFDVSFGMNPGKISNLRFITDGYLFSYAPVYTDKNRMSTGMSLHMDFISLGKWDVQDSTIDTYSSALDWTIKYQYLPSEETSMHVKLHAGFTFFGASEYYTPLDPSSEEWHPSVPATGRNARKTYNYGINSKLYLGFKNKIIGNFDAFLMYYLMFPYLGTSEFTDGHIQWFIAELTYSHLVTKHISLGVTNAYSMERGVFNKRYSVFPYKTHKWANAVTFFAAWNK